MFGWQILEFPTGTSKKEINQKIGFDVYLLNQHETRATHNNLKLMINSKENFFYSIVNVYPNERTFLLKKWKKIDCPGPRVISIDKFLNQKSLLKHVYTRHSALGKLLL